MLSPWTTKGAFIYITATFNYHKDLYHRRGGKTLIRVTSLHTHTCAWPSSPFVSGLGEATGGEAAIDVQRPAQIGWQDWKVQASHGSHESFVFLEQYVQRRSPMVGVLKRIYLHFRLMATAPNFWMCLNMTYMQTCWICVFFYHKALGSWSTSRWGRGHTSAHSNQVVECMLKLKKKQPCLVVSRIQNKEPL